MRTSPNYPEGGEYPRNFDGFQTIQVPEGNTIWMKFTEFELNDEEEVFVTVTDKDGTLLGHFDEENSHDDWEEEFESNTNMVKVRFHTDDSWADDGWELQWGKFRLIALHNFNSLLLTGIVGDEESRQKRGVLTSPNFPQLYPDNHESTQTIRVAEGKIIYIEFTNFNTEREYDFVTLTDDDGTDLTDQLINGGAALSGKKVDLDELPFAWIHSNIVHVHFHTDGNTQRSGWKLEWQAQV